MEEKRLIDVDKLIDFIDVGHLRHPGELCYSEVDVANLLLHAPTVDAVEVVRCKDCARCFKYTTKRNRQMMWICMRNEMDVCVRPDDFCSYGERRDGE